MLRTLHGYLIRDLLRVTILALVAFTLVMTVFAIIEPLRKQGLAPAQALQLFLFTIPVTLSLTLPFSALFATSIVYGRFSQDREMLACRASGLSHLTLLQPALGLAVAVSVLTLALTNFVAPHMLKLGAHTVVKDIQKIVYHMIKKESHIKFKKKYFVHASYVDEEKDILYGVVAGEFDMKKDPRTGRTVPVMQAIVAQAAHLNIHHDPATDQYTASIVPHEMVGPITNQPGVMIEGEEVPLQNLPIPNYMEDKPSFYEWNTLIRMYDDPTLHGKIRTEMDEIRRKVRRHRVLVGLAEVIRSGKPYTKFRKGEQQYSLRASSAAVHGDTAVLSFGKKQDGTEIPVTLTITKGKTPPVPINAQTAEVLVKPSQISNEPQVTIILKGDVKRPVGRTDTPEAPRIPELKIGQIALPDDPKMPHSDDPRQRREMLSALYHHPKEFTSDAGILNEIDNIRSQEPPKIRREIIAEMNVRVAFGLSCALLVALGAALGVIFRGGQMLVAFVISVAPTAAVFVLILAGKKMISNPDSSDLAGLVLMWSGLVVMLIVDAVIYYRLSKQ
ncbi:MAG: LptF/LptG family permease [Phycisphaerae bacterium]|nr:LptF/LptG family permease [Phycisphaerae bacterium]